MRRFCDVLLSAGALVLFAPLLAVVSLAVMLDSGFPIFFLQTRVGRFGQPFRLWKIRTMRTGQPGAAITIHGDERITRVGRWLRRTRLDELPQLAHVLTGSMSLLGPRPEIPLFVDTSKEEWKAVLSVRPGLFDPATLQWLDEGRYIAGRGDPLIAYRNDVLPKKLALSRAYLENRSLVSDARFVVSAAVQLFRSRSARLKK